MHRESYHKSVKQSLINKEESTSKSDGSTKIHVDNKKTCSITPKRIFNFLKSFIMFCPMIVSGLLQIKYPGRYELQQSVQLIMYVPSLLSYIYLGIIKKIYKVFPKTLDLFPIVNSCASAIYVFTGHAEYYNHWGSTWLGFAFTFIIVGSILINRPLIFEIMQENYDERMLNREYISLVGKRATWHLAIVFLIANIAFVIYSFNANYLNSDNSKAKALNVGFYYILTAITAFYYRFVAYTDMRRYGDKLRAKYGYIPTAIEEKWEKDGLDISNKNLHTEYLEEKNGGVIFRY